MACCGVGTVGSMDDGAMDGVSADTDTDEGKTVGGGICCSTGAGAEIDSCDGMLKKSTDSAEEDWTGFSNEFG